MSNYIVIYDRDKEIAAIVDTEAREGWGPAMIGDNAETLLEGFLASIPYDLSAISPTLARTWFEQYMQAVSSPDTPPPVAPTSGAMGQATDTSVVDAATAEREANEQSAAPPPPQPADTDMETHAGETETVTPQPPAQPAQQETPAPAEPQYEGPCFACEGKGVVPGVDGEVVCNVCRGTGHLPAPVQA